MVGVNFSRITTPIKTPKRSGDIQLSQLELLRQSAKIHMSILKPLPTRPNTLISNFGGNGQLQTSLKLTKTKQKIDYVDLCKKLGAKNNLLNHSKIDTKGFTVPGVLETPKERLFLAKPEIQHFSEKQRLWKTHEISSADSDSATTTQINGKTWVS